MPINPKRERGEGISLSLLLLLILLLLVILVIFFLNIVYELLILIIVPVKMDEEMWLQNMFYKSVIEIEFTCVWFSFKMCSTFTDVPPKRY